MRFQGLITADGTSRICDIPSNQTVDVDLNEPIDRCDENLEPFHKTTNPFDETLDLFYETLDPFDETTDHTIDPTVFRTVDPTTVYQTVDPVMVLSSQ